jgi:hypothetical protein
VCSPKTSHVATELVGSAAHFSSLSITFSSRHSKDASTLKRLASQATESEPVVSTDLTQPITESTSSRTSIITSQLASSEESASQTPPASLNGC